MYPNFLNSIHGERWLRQEVVIAFGLAVIFGGGIIAHLSQTLFPFSIKITEYLLFAINTGVMLHLFLRFPSKRLSIYSGILLLATFLLEVIGVHTGIVFGSYKYGEVLGVKAWGVPLIITLNWLLLIISANVLAGDMTGKKVIRIFLAPILIVLFDLVMEPVAMQLNYWDWHNHTIPFKNYASWFIIALLFSVLYNVYAVTVKSLVLKAYFITQFVFFLFLHLLFRSG